MALSAISAASAVSGAALSDRSGAGDVVVVLRRAVLVPAVALEIVEGVRAGDDPIVCERRDAGVCADERSLAVLAAVAT